MRTARQPNMFDASFLAKTLVESIGINPDDLPELYNRLTDDIATKVAQKLQDQNIDTLLIDKE